MSEMRMSHKLDRNVFFFFAGHDFRFDDIVVKSGTYSYSKLEIIIPKTGNSDNSIKSEGFVK